MTGRSEPRRVWWICSPASSLRPSMIVTGIGNGQQPAFRQIEVHVCTGLVACPRNRLQRLPCRRLLLGGLTERRVPVGYSVYGSPVSLHINRRLHLTARYGSSAMVHRRARMPSE
ncbi:hypothetical protein IG631_24274 [Alternaria alternata]|nr:hypothetical protein IG631_24274 [Alternaria alternata]